MIPSNDLFDLIKSMTKSEKRYFKLLVKLAGNRKQNNTLKLFDAIDKLKAYDEAELKKKFKHERFVKQFAFNKNYLQNLIIKSLVFYHQDTTVYNQIYNLLNSAEVLFNKGQLSLCMKSISKGKDLCLKYDQKVLLDRFIEMESKILMLKSEFSNVVSVIDDQISNHQKYLDVLNIKLYAFNMHVLSLGYRYQHDDKYPDVESMYKKVSNSNPESLIGKRYKYAFFIHYYSLKNKHKKVLEYNKKCIDLLESNKQYKVIVPAWYITEYTNYCSSLIQFGKIDEANQISQKIREIYNEAIQKTNSIDLIPMILLCYNFEVFISMIVGNVDKIEEIDSQFETYLKKFEDVTPASNFYDISFNMAVNHFFCQNYDRVNEWIDKILYKSKTEYVDDIYYFARFLSLITHFEKGNHKLLLNLINSTQRFFKMKNLLKEEDQALLNLLKHSSRKGEIDEERLLALNELLGDTSNKNVVTSNPLKSFVKTWVRSKIEKKPMLKLFSEDFNAEVEAIKKSEG